MVELDGNMGWVVEKRAKLVGMEGMRGGVGEGGTKALFLHFKFRHTWLSDFKLIINCKLILENYI